MTVSGQQVSGIQKLGMMPARKVAEAGLRGLSAGSRVVVPGWLNRVYAPTLRALPSTLKTGIARLAMQSFPEAANMIPSILLVGAGGDATVMVG